MKKPTSKLEKFLGKDHPGALTALYSQWSYGESLPWSLTLIARFMGWIVVAMITMVVFLNLIPPDLHKPVRTWIVAYLIYLSLIESMFIFFEEKYASSILINLRLQANIALFGLLIWSSGGVQSRFWPFYVIPIFSAILYFKNKYLLQLILLSEIILTYWLSAVYNQAHYPLDVLSLAVQSSVIGLIWFILMILSALHSRMVFVQKQSLDLLELHKSSNIIVSTVHMKDILMKILTEVTSHLGYESAAVFIKNPSANVLTVAASSNYPPEIEKNLCIKIDSECGLTGLVASTGKAIITPNVHVDPRYIPGVPGSQSEIDVPIRVGSQVIGVLSVESTKLNAFSDQDLQLLSAYAVSCAVALDKARLIGALNEVGKAVSQTLASNRAPVGLKEMITRFGAELLDAEACSLYLLRRPGYLTWETCYGITSDPTIGDIYHPGQEICLHLNSPTSYLSQAVRYFCEPENSSEVPFLQIYPSTGTRHDHIHDRTLYSVLVAPIKAYDSSSDNDVLGLLVAENKLAFAEEGITQGIFSDNDTGILRTLADYMAITIENEQITRLSEAMAGVNKVFDSSRTFSTMLSQILETLKTIVDYQTATIQLLDGDELTIEECAGFSAEDRVRVNALRFPLIEKYPNYEVIQTGRPLLIPDIYNSNYKHFWEEAQLWCSGHIRSWIGVPLISDRKVIGMISIDGVEARQYDPVHRDLAYAFACQVSPIILRSRANQISNNFYKVSLWMMNNLNTESVLQWIADGPTSRDGLRADSVIIYPLLPMTNDQVGNPIYAGKLIQPEHIQPPLSPDSVVYRALKAKDPIQYHRSETPQILERQFVWREGIHSSIALPLRFIEMCQGVMFVNYCRRHPFLDVEIQWLQQYAALAAISIHNAERFQAAQQLIWPSSISLIWTHSLTGKLFPLTVDLNTLKRAIDAYDETRKSNPTLIQNLLERIEQNLRALSSVLPNLGTQNDTQITYINLEEVIDTVIKNRREDQTLPHDRIEVECSLSHLPKVFAYRGGLLFVFDELIKNAAREMQDIGGKLNIAGKIYEDRVTINITDTGHGIPEHIRSQLFKDQPVLGAKGSGLGLRLVRIVLKMYGGEIELTKWQDGASFLVTIPITIDSGLKPDIGSRQN